MAVEENQIKDILPTGDQLRAMISQSFLTGKNLRDLLQSKGVFIDENDKNKSVPLLMTSILSPNEFKTLVENQTTKEEKFKVNTLTIPCKTDKKLLEVIPNDFYNVPTHSPGLRTPENDPYDAKTYLVTLAKPLRV